jgi:glycosyltransferase involved in cell wall biosynthesis
MYGVGAPVVIGPLNGAMDLPPAFTNRQSRLTNLSVALTRLISKPLNWLFPGKPRAAAVLVSNERTRRALPAGCEAQSIKLVANAVEVAVWQPPDRTNRSGPITFVTTGRLVSFKALDHLLEAFKPVTEQTEAKLVIIGEGHLRGDLERQADDLGIAEHVEFTGWLKPEQAVERMSEADVFVFPSLQDCGGAVIMEAMCLGLPCISSDWGGGPDYMGEGTGLLVPVDSRDTLVNGFTEAMLKIARDDALREQLSQTALEASKQFDWTKRVELLMGVYDKCLNPDQAA